jgi:hypothetical protein
MKLRSPRASRAEEDIVIRAYHNGSLHQAKKVFVLSTEFASTCECWMSPSAAGPVVQITMISTGLTAGIMGTEANTRT